MERLKNRKEELGDSIQSQSNLRGVRIRLIITYVALIIAAVIAVSTLTINSAEALLARKTSSLLSSLNMQMKLSVDNYLDELEEMSSFVFSEPLNYTYDPAQSADEEEKEQALEQITQSLQAMSLMKNLGDFAIAYRSGDYAGRISDGTRGHFGEDLYKTLEESIRVSGSQDGWNSGYDGDYSRLYYAKRLNENAILFLSVFTSELSHVFELNADAERMTVCLADDQNKIIYSSVPEEIGQDLQENMQEPLSEDSSASVRNSQYMYNISTCGDDWRVLCVMEADTIDREYQRVRMDAAIVAVFIIILGIIASLLLSRSVTNPLNMMVGGLSEKAESDQLTGNLNKITFERYAEEWLNDEENTCELAYFLTDVDDFKLVNDICGHAAGDRVLKQYGQIIKDLFYRDLTGRIGGDEFAMLVKIPDTETPRVYVAEKVKALQKRVAQIHEENADIHVSIGIAFRGDEKHTLSEMYRNADKALYATKRRGKNGYTIYTKEISGEEEI